jgi:hypothetical protein
MGSNGGTSLGCNYGDTHHFFDQEGQFWAALVSIATLLIGKLNPKQNFFSAVKCAPARLEEIKLLRPDQKHTNALHIIIDNDDGRLS